MTQPSGAKINSDLLRPLLQTSWRFFLLVASLLFFGIISYVANSPRLFRSAFGIEGINFALLFATTGLGIIIGQLANNRLIARLGLKKHQTVLITGAAGFLGRYFSELLAL